MPLSKAGFVDVTEGGALIVTEETPALTVRALLALMPATATRAWPAPTLPTARTRTLFKIAADFALALARFAAFLHPSHHAHQQLGQPTVVPGLIIDAHTATLNP